MRVLAAGGLVAFPTETVYGLGADALNAAAVRGVFELKGRPSHNPLIVHVTDAGMARSLVAEGRWDSRAERIADQLWPGPITMVLPRAAHVPNEVTAGSDTVALRCPDHPVSLALLRAFGRPMVGPSANRSGRVSPTTARHVAAEFDETLLILDGGACRAGIESTVVDLSRAGAPPRILRPGVVSASQLEAVLGEPVVGASTWSGASGEAHGGKGKGVESRQGVTAPLLSPGMLDRHYAPRTRAILFHLSEWPTVERLAADAEDDRLAVGVMLIGGDGRCRLSPPHVLVEMPARAEDYAAGLYATLHELDAKGLHLIAIQSPPISPVRTQATAEDSVWMAIADRLRRACHPA